MVAFTLITIVPFVDLQNIKKKSVDSVIINMLHSCNTIHKNYQKEYLSNLIVLLQYNFK